jgi:hypothetical protein
MPTQTKSTPKSTPKTANGVEGIVERVVDFGRRAGHNYLDTAEQASYRVADVQQQLGGQSPIKWIGDVTEAQADVMREVTQAYVSAGRKLIG